LRVIWSATALADLSSIVAFIEERDGAQRGEKVRSRIQEAADTLGFMPGMGHERHYFRPGARTFTVRPWVIIYRPLPDGDGIRIQGVVDGRRDLSTLRR
jgi:plasmid stabilization system protein ParE